MKPEAPGVLTRVSAIALFATTVTTMVLTWLQPFWRTALTEVAVFSLAACWIFVHMIRGEKPRFSTVLIPLTAVALWPALQLAVGATIYRWATSVSLLYWTAGAAIVFVGTQIFADAAILRRYLRGLVILGFVMAVIAPLQLFTSGGKIYWLFDVPYSNIAMGPFLYPNQYAAFIELVLPIALTRLSSDDPAWRPFHALAAAVMYASIFAATSRTGFVFTTLEIIVVPILVARRMGIDGRRLLVSGALFFGMLVILGLAVGPDRLIAKMKQKDPYAGRREYAESSLRMIPDKPFMGVGLGNWPAAYPAYATFDEGYFANQAHNDWAQWAVEGGVPFALLMLWVAGWSVKKGIGTEWGIGVGMVFLHCFVDFPITPIAVAIVLFSLIGAMGYPDERAGSARRIRDGHRAKSHR